LNPYLAQTCFCLDRYLQTTWPQPEDVREPYQSFLANSFDEALSGAIKLARYTCNLAKRSPRGLVLDPAGRLGHFAKATIAGQGTIDFIPELTVVAGFEELASQLDAQTFGFVVLAGALDEDTGALGKFQKEQAGLLVTCVDRRTLADCRRGAAGSFGKFVPDVVVFDESFVNRAVPFAAFTARKRLYAQWHKIGGGAFHSTTYQPNTVSTLHFMRCAERDDPDFHAEIAGELDRIRRLPVRCASVIGSLYSRFLVKAMAALGFDGSETHASGHYVTAGDSRVFDGVAGVACSIRGHNPPSYLEEIEALSDVDDAEQAVAVRLRDLTGLEQMLPAVSGASAVENALRIGLVTQFPRRHILAFSGGFGGKTLLALTGTAKAFYKIGLDPLYPNVIYVDPFAANAVASAEAVLKQFPIAIVQLELIQAVGGVRALPLNLLHFLDEKKREHGFLLFVDEVQTGMYRTGPFTLSERLGIKPDILTLGKGTSDMMFPYALTLYSQELRCRLAGIQSTLPAEIREKHAYDHGYRTVLNVLQQAEGMGVEERVIAAGELFSHLLREQLADCHLVREVRVHGLLIAIELDVRSLPHSWFKKKLSTFYLLSMLRQEFPLLIGYCQYEPNVLKLTPPLSITTEEIHQVCNTIATALRKPFYKVFLRALGALTTSTLKAKWRPRPA
jgi:acetylornithine/succinyldiaminopimelate/putrescine aminotransferase